LRGGFIGFVSGLLPGIGGSVGDIMAYGAAVARNPRETFGNGNIKGLLGCEGANNAQKASSMVPTVLFGIPGAPFAAIMMAICVYFGMELGTPETLKDTVFFWSLGGAFIASTILAFVIAMFTTRIVVKLLEIPYWIYAVLILSIIVWSCLEYTGTVNDLYILALCSVLGVACKKFGISRPAVMVAFILVEKLENYIQQTQALYTINELATRPIFVSLTVISIAIIAYSIFRPNRGLAYH
jgi:TctA family transporter